MKYTKYLLLLMAVFTLSACEPEVIDNTPRPTLGNSNAPILVEEFSDLQCPACANVSPQVEKFILQNPTLARFEYRHYPLPQHENAFKAAEAAECAHEQGRFWDYINWAFSNQSGLDEQSLKDQAANMGLNANDFNNCLDSGRKRGRILADIKEGQKRQLSFTPSIYVNGELINWGGPEEFKKYLESL